MTIRVGMIGAGMIADDHCASINRYSGAEVVAVADVSKARREELKTRYNMARAYDSWGKLVADREIDAVAIALPNALHAPAGLAALQTGKHVLIDKPFALNFGEAKRLADVAARKRLVLMVGMNQRYSHAAQMLRTLTARGDLGEIYHTKAYWCRRMGAPKFGTWFVNKALSGGGCLLDIGVHILDLGMYLSDCWDPEAVSGRVYTKFGHRGIGEGGWGKSDRRKDLKFDVDDFAVGLIKCRSGATIELNVSWVLHQERDQHDVELFGTEAGARLNPVKLFRQGKVKGEYEVIDPQNVQVESPRECRQFDWLDAITGKRQPICSIKQALTVQKVLDAIYKSSASGREVRIR
jgi:predicted dehydrogenase